MFSLTVDGLARARCESLEQPLRLDAQQHRARVQVLLRGRRQRGAVLLAAVAKLQVAQVQHRRHQAEHCVLLLHRDAHQRHRPPRRLR